MTRSASLSRSPGPRRLAATLLMLVVLLAPAAGPAHAQPPAVTAWKVTWQIRAEGTHSETNDGFTSFTRRSTTISGEAVVTNQPDGTNLISPFQLNVSDDLYAVFRHFDERNSWAINEFNITNPGHYSGDEDPAWSSGHLFVPERDDDGSYYMSADAFGSDFLAVDLHRPFTYRTQITTHEGAWKPILSPQSYYSQVLLNQVTASKEIDKIPGDPTGRFFQLDEQFTVSPESGGMGGDMENMPVHIQVSIRPYNECDKLGNPIAASDPNLSLMRDSIRVRLEPDEPFIVYDGDTYVKGYLTCDGVPITGAELQFGADVVAFSGAHNHHDIDRPRGWLDNVRATAANYKNVIQRTTDDKGMAEFLYVPGADTRTDQRDISGIYRLRGFAPAFGAETWVSIDAKLPGLVELPYEGPHYEVIGQTVGHIENNYGTPATVAAIEDMAEKFIAFQGDMNAARARRGAKQLPVMPLLIGDLSLPWGGHFDVSGPRGRARYWEPPYADHDMGEEVSFVPDAYYDLLVAAGMTPAEATDAAVMMDLMVRVNASTFGTWVGDSLRIHQGQGAQAAGLAAADPSPAVFAALSGHGVALNPVAAPGQPVRIGLAYHNRDGGAPAPAATLTVTLPDGLRYVGADRAPQSVSGRTITWALGELAAGALPELIMLDVAVEPGAAVGTTLPVAVQLSAGADANPADNQQRVEVTVRPLGPDLHVASTLDETPLIVGRPTPFTVTVTNYGTAAATSPELRVALPAGAALVSSAPAHSGATGASAFRWLLPALAPNESRTVALTMTLDPVLATAGTAPLGFELAAGTGAQADAGPLDNALTVKRPLDPGADLAVSLARRGKGVAGQEADYVLGYVNVGGQEAGASTATLTLASGVSLVSASRPATATPIADGRTLLSWGLGDLGPGEGGHIVVRLRGGAATEGSALQAEALGSAPEADGENNLAVLGATWSVPAGRPDGLPFRVALPLVRR